MYDVDILDSILYICVFKVKGFLCKLPNDEIIVDVARHPRGICLAIFCFVD